MLNRLSSLTRMANRRRPSFLSTSLRSLHFHSQVGHPSRHVMVPLHFHGSRSFSASTSKEDGDETENDTNAGSDGVNGGDGVENAQENASDSPDTSENAPDTDSAENLQQKLEGELKEMKEKYLFALSEQENIRSIAKKDITRAREFGVEKFAKKLLDTADNFSRAREHVKVEELDKNDQLKALYDGLVMTENNFLKALEAHNIVKFCEIGDVFDPKQCDALFELGKNKLLYGYYTSTKVPVPSTNYTSTNLIFYFFIDMLW